MKISEQWNHFSLCFKKATSFLPRVFLSLRADSARATPHLVGQRSRILRQWRDWWGMLLTNFVPRPRLFDTTFSGRHAFPWSSRMNASSQMPSSRNNHPFETSKVLCKELKCHQFLDENVILKRSDLLESPAVVENRSASRAGTRSQK